MKQRKLSLIFIALLTSAVFVGLFQIELASAATVQIISNNFTVNAANNIETVHPAANSTFLTSLLGQNLTTPSDHNHTLTKATFYLYKSGSPNAPIVCQVFEQGSNGFPTGSAIATSDSIQASTLTTDPTAYNFSFSGANQINLTKSHVYDVVVLSLSATLLNSSNCYLVGCKTNGDPNGFGIKFWGTATPQWSVTADHYYALWGEDIDEASPTFGSITGNTTIAGANVRYNCTVSDDVSVSGFIGSTNNTGSWVNNTWASGSSGTLTGTHNATVGNIISVKFYANDSVNHWASSSISNFTLTADTYTVSLTPDVNPASLSTDVVITVGITRTTGNAVTDYAVNITLDGAIFKTNFSSTSFVYQDATPAAHTFAVTGLYDNSSTATVTPTNTPITVLWHQVSGGGGGGDTDEEPSPTPIETSTPVPSATATPFQLPNLTLPKISQNEVAIIAFILIIAFVVALLITSAQKTVKRRLSTKKGYSTEIRLPKKPKMGVNI